MHKIFHPWLLAIFPTLFLFQHNIDQANFSETILPVIITLIVTAILWFFLRLLVKDIDKSAVLSSLFLVLFFSFGHIYALLQISYETLLYTQAVIFCVALYLCLKTKRSFEGFSKFLNISSSVLVMLSVVNCMWFLYSAKEFKSPQRIMDEGKKDTEKKPDIYYIIVDGYARKDILKDMYSYDNTFVPWLEEKGFFVAHESRSNYPQTYLSLASSLNSTYLNNLRIQLGKNYRSRTPLKRLIYDNNVVYFLKRHHYKFVAFSSGYSGTELTNADSYLAANRYPISEFQRVLMNVTPLVKVSHAPLLNLVAEGNHAAQRKRILYTLDKLGQLETQSPTFVFAHIICPHPPFVFDKEGEIPQHTFALKDDMIKKGENVAIYIKSYREQVDFLNRKLRNMITQILQKSRESIIMIQADHGPSLQIDADDHKVANCKEKFSILNAYYFPHKKYQNLYPEISPVNSFRVVFHEYFSTDLKLLPDKSYFASWAYPYNFIELSEEDFAKNENK